jgi:outer membrane protein OmpA-like peptidoglycan-associated protein
MKKLVVVVLITLFATFSSACVATRKFTRNEVKTSADTLNAKIDTTATDIKENVDRVDQRVTTVDGKVTDLDGRTTTAINSVKGDVQAVKGEVSAVDQKAGQAQTLAQRATGDITNLGQKFQDRNQFAVVTEKAVPFKFDSAKLDDAHKAALDEVATALSQNPNAIIVLEGRTDSTGNSEYNVKLGERRVDAVRRYLAVEKTVPVYRIHEISLGAARPIAPNDSRDGREKNRAVVISVLSPTADGAVAAKENN